MLIETHFLCSLKGRKAYKIRQIVFLLTGHVTFEAKYRLSLEQMVSTWELLSSMWLLGSVSHAVRASCVWEEGCGKTSTSSCGRKWDSQHCGGQCCPIIPGKNAQSILLCIEDILGTKKNPYHRKLSFKISLQIGCQISCSSMMRIRKSEKF